MQVHGGSGSFLNQLIFESNQFPQFRIFFEPIGQSHIPNEVLGTLAGVYKVLAVVVMRIRGLCSLRGMNRKLCVRMERKTYLPLEMSTNPCTPSSRKSSFWAGYWPVLRLHRRGKPFARRFLRQCPKLLLAGRRCQGPTGSENVFVISIIQNSLGVLQLTVCASNFRLFWDLSLELFRTLLILACFVANKHRYGRPR